MLERTAASLEPCNFQRILPSKKTPFKSNRRLHTAFWQHGAADIESSSVWQALIRAPLDPLTFLPTTHANKPESLRASTTLLDFLYPQSAISILRRSSPYVLDRNDRPRPYLRGSVPRLFTSAASDRQRSTSDSSDATTTDSRVEGASKQTAKPDLERAVDSAEDVSAQDVHTQDRSQETTAIDDAMTTNAATESISAQEIDPQEGQALDKNHNHDASSGLETPNVSEPSQSPQSIPGIEGKETGGHIANYSLEEEPDAAHGGESVPTERQMRRIRVYEAAMDKLRQLPQDQHAAEFDNIWSAFHGIQRVVQGPYRSSFFNYITKHRSKSQLLASALRMEKFGFLLDLWEHFAFPRRENGIEFDWAAFEAVFTVDELSISIRRFIDQIESLKTRNSGHASPVAVLESCLHGMIYRLMHRYAAFFDHTVCIPMLEPLQDKYLYEEFLRVIIEKPDKITADALYQRYRKLPGITMQSTVMNKMLHHIYWPDNGAGMELVAKDIYARNRRLTPGQHRRLMMYYSRQGDAPSVERTWAKYEAQLKAEEGKEWKPKPEEYSPLLHAYAVRGELNHVRRIFTDLQTKYGPELNTHCWNILLNAHAKAQEYEAAIRVFTAMRQTVELDRHSFGTMMGMTGSRGDIEFTLDMYRMAREQGIENDVAIIDSVIEVYCQNDRLSDAEKICEIATTSGEHEPAALTILWTTVLDHLAQQRDLVSMHRILNGMAESKIPYSSKTYSALLRGLALCRQPDHALYLVKEAVRTHSFKPDVHHYALLMSAYVRTRQPHRALKVSNYLKTIGLPAAGHILVRVIEALGSWAGGARRGKDGNMQRRKLLVTALRDFRSAVELSSRPRKKVRPQPKKPRPWLDRDSGGPDQTLLTTARQARLLCFIFAQMREMATVQDILEMWRASSPQASELPEPPLILLSSLMLAAFHDQNYEEVENIWTIAFNTTKQQSQLTAPGMSRDTSLPALRYVLSDALRVMLRTYSVKQDPEGLINLVSSVREAGFELDSKNKNYYVQMLASLKQWREAFVTCEEELMPHWLGWYRVRQRETGIPTRIPLDIRRRGQDPQTPAPRPISFTLLVLSKAYMDLEQMAAWSTEAERLLMYIIEKCPLAIAAIQSRVGSPTALEADIMSGQEPRKKPWPMKFIKPMRGHADDQEYPSADVPSPEQLSGEDAGAEDAEDDWYDVDAQTEETWTPMTLNQQVKPSKKKRSKRNDVDVEPLYDSEGRLVEGFGVVDGPETKASF